MKISDNNMSTFSFLDYEKVFHRLPMPVLVLTRDLKVIMTNGHAKSLFPAISINHRNTSIKSLTSLEQLEIIVSAIEQALNSEKTVSCIIPPNTQWNSSGSYRVSIEIIDPSNPHILLVFEPNIAATNHQSGQEVSHEMKNTYSRKVTEELIEGRLNAAIMQSDTTIVVTDLEGNILFANPKFEFTTGYSVKEALGQNPRILQSGEQSPEYYQELWNTIRNGKVWKGEFKNKRKDGSYYWESATITPIKDEKGNLLEYLAIKEDITQRKRMEEKLEHALEKMEAANWELKMLNKDLKQEVERRKNVESELKLQKDLLQELNENLENQVKAEVDKNRQKDELMLLQSRQAAMGEMIGNIAHQWRQPLNSVGLMVYDLVDAFRFGEVDQNYLSESEKSIKDVLGYMSATIDDFRNFFKPNKEKQNFYLHECIKTSVSFIEATLKNSGIRLIIDIPDNIELYGYASEFAQVVLNIVNNAKDALLENKPEKPVIRLSATSDHKKAVLIIIDNAGGIPGCIIHKIFDPYFTTKDQGKGTGVGLYMSKTIIERNMSGSIVVNNSRTGAEFVITIPLAENN